MADMCYNCSYFYASFFQFFSCKAETALREAQADYDIHLDTVREGMRKIVQTHVNNLGRMKTLMSSLKAYYIECIAHLDDIDTGMSL